MPKPLSVTSLVLGLVSLLLGFTFFVPIAAIVFGAVAARREPQGRTMAIWGIVLGALCIVGWLVLVLVLVVVLAATAGGDLLSGLAQSL